MDFKPNWQWLGIDPKAKHIFTEHCSATTRWPCWTSKVCLHVWSAGSSFFWKVFSWLLARWYTMLWKDGVTNNNFGQQESRDGYRLVFFQGISMGNYFLRGSWERHFGDSFQGAIFLEVSLRVEGWSLFSKADYNVCSSAQGEYFVNLPDGRLQKVPWWFVLFVIYFNQGDLLCKRWRRICGRSLLHWRGSGLARLCNGEDADHDHCAVCLWWQHYPQYPPEPAGGYGRK